MAKCATCGRPAGFMMSLCDPCIQRQIRGDRAEVAGLKRPKAVAPHMVTTNPDIPGRRAAAALGLARGISVRSRSFFGNIAAAAQSTLGGDITALEKLCEDTRKAAFDRLCEHAGSLGADAVVGVRYDANEVFEGITEVLCYGTAVTLEPITPRAEQYEPMTVA